MRAANDFGRLLQARKVLQCGTQEPHTIRCQRALSKLIHNAQGPGGMTDSSSSHHPESGIGTARASDKLSEVASKCQGKIIVVA
jgi:hypothetical protein